MNKEALQEFYQKNKIIIFPVLVAISSLILIVLIIYPQISGLINTNSTLLQVKQKSGFLEVKAQELQSLDEVQLQKDLGVALNALPSNQDYLEVINIIQGLLNQNAFSLQTLQFGQGDNTAGKPSFIVKMEISGPKSALNQLLTSMESTYRPMRLASIETNSPKQGSSTINATVAVNVFYSPLPTTLGSVEAPLPILSDRDQELVTTLAKSVSLVAVGNVSVSVLRGKTDPFE